MQDNGVAWIFGEDKQTGAGGANVVEYTGFFSAVLPKDFPILPFVGELATTHQDMRVAWRQGVRQGPNAGKLLEDFGVVADSIVRPYVADIVNSTSDSQWVRISEQLGRIGASSGLDKVAFSTRPDLYSKVSIGDDFNIQVETSGLSRVIINYENGTLISEIDLKAPNTVLSLPKTASSVLGLQRYQLLAKDNKGKTVVETYRFVRVQPAKDGWLTLNATTTYQGPNVQTLTLDSFKTSQASVDFYNPESDALLGWRYNGSVLLVGDGVKYRDNVETRISIFGHAAPIVSVKIVADYDTELDYDYFTIGYVDQKGENSLVSTTAINTTTTINGVSGNGQIDQNFEINPVGDFEFYMQFKSDGGTTAQGVTISTLHMIGGVFE